tara:strand:- start:505 stop:822 length:318 start_codon:yes stop_codon:yes gene_type:complete
MKNYKIEYIERNIHTMYVPANSKKEALQFVEDRLHWDLEDFDYSSDSYQVREISLLKRLPINLKDEKTAKWWERVQDSRKNWLEHKEEKRLANQEAENNKLRTDF